MRGDGTLMGRESMARGTRGPGRSGGRPTPRVRFVYETAKADLTRWPGTNEYVRAFLDTAAGLSRADLRATGIEVTSTDQLHQVAPAFESAPRAGRVPYGLLPPGARDAQAAPAASTPGRNSTRRVRRAGIASGRRKMG